MTLRFAEKTGNCGPFGLIEYQPETGDLEEFDCEVSERRVEECSVVEQLDCVHDNGPETGVLELSMSLGWNNENAWLGGADLALESEESNIDCTSEYNLRADP